jgi:tRNA dimethylallyltransferase
MRTIVCLMGPTASGKTQLTYSLVKALPFEVISVDSALVYRGMDIGTAKPTSEELTQVPHRLIDIREPTQAYSAAEFRQDALQEIESILQQQKVPLLVGGTMLYFHVLQQGIAKLPPANAEIRQQLQTEVTAKGLEFLHQRLSKVDPTLAAQIHANDSQRILRALEVYEATGVPLSQWQQQAMPTLPFKVINIGLMPSDRKKLHQDIAARFQQMLGQGLVEEVKQLMQSEGFTSQLPAMRSVGYRQVIAYLQGKYDYTQMVDKAVAATRQLAKRQMTWLRRWQEISLFDCYANHLLEEIIAFLNSSKS